jgi:hypothetical protein
VKVSKQNTNIEKVRKKMTSFFVIGFPWIFVTFQSNEIISKLPINGAGGFGYLKMPSHNFKSSMKLNLRFFFRFIISLSLSLSRIFVQYTIAVIL